MGGTALGASGRSNNGLKLDVKTGKLSLWRLFPTFTFVRNTTGGNNRRCNGLAKLEKEGLCGGGLSRPSSDHSSGCSPRVHCNFNLEIRQPDRPAFTLWPACAGSQKWVGGASLASQGHPLVAVLATLPPRTTCKRPLSLKPLGLLPLAWGSKSA